MPWAENRPVAWHRTAQTHKCLIHSCLSRVSRCISRVQVECSYCDELQNVAVHFQLWMSSLSIFCLNFFQLQYMCVCVCEYVYIHTQQWCSDIWYHLCSFWSITALSFHRRNGHVGYIFMSINSHFPYPQISMKPQFSVRHLCQTVDFFRNIILLLARNFLNCLKLQVL